jgi:hypothetical protein
MRNVHWQGVLVWWVCLLMATDLLAQPLAAQALDDDAAVEAGREALSRRGQPPWYDRQKDDVRRVDVGAPPSPPKAGDWEAQPRSATPRRESSVWAAVMQALLYCTYAGLVLLLVALVALLIRAFLRSEARSAASKQQILVGTDEDVDRVEELPFQVRRPAGDFLAEARRHYEAGNYSEAIIYFYSHLLMELDRNQLIRLTRGKTNRQYVREVRPQPRLQDLLKLTMIAFEDVFFGHHVLDRGRFESCFDRLDEFESQLREVAA